MAIKQLSFGGVEEESQRCKGRRGEDVSGGGISLMVAEIVAIPSPATSSPLLACLPALYFTLMHFLFYPTSGTAQVSKVSHLTTLI